MCSTFEMEKTFSKPLVLQVTEQMSEQVTMADPGLGLREADYRPCACLIHWVALNQQALYSSVLLPLKDNQVKMHSCVLFLFYSLSAWNAFIWIVLK